MCENARMESIKVETLMNHDLKLGESYYKPNEQVLRDEYLKAVPLLTIEGSKLSNQQLAEIESRYEAKTKELEKQVIMLRFEKVIDNSIDQQRQKLKPSESLNLVQNNNYNISRKMHQNRFTTKENLAD